MLVTTASMSNLSLSAEQLYSFVDERGVRHFSNVPIDRRYKPIEGLLAGRAESQVERKPVEETRALPWPPLGEQVNDMIEEVPGYETDMPADMRSK